MKGKWKAAVAKVMSGDDVRAEWAKIRDKELKDGGMGAKKDPGEIFSLREATMALLKRERQLNARVRRHAEHLRVLAREAERERRQTGLGEAVALVVVDLRRERAPGVPEQNEYQRSD